MGAFGDSKKIAEKSLTVPKKIEKDRPFNRVRFCITFLKKKNEMGDPLH